MPMRKLTKIAIPVFVIAGTSLVLAVPARVVPIEVARAGAPQQSEVQITMSNVATHPRLGLPDFVVPGNDPELRAAAKTIADVLWDDLQYEREYYMIERRVSAAIPVAPADALPFAAWTDMGAELVLAAAARRDGSNIVVDVRTIGVKGPDQGREIFRSQYKNCRLDQLRLCAHTIADDFHKQTRGLDGVARTKIAFVSDRAGARSAGRGQPPVISKEIYIVDYDGADPKRLTVNGRLNLSPVWAPRGGLLAYASWMSGYPDIYVADMGQPGRALKRPAGGTAAVHNWSPSWSPDGSKIAFASNRAGGAQFDVWVVNRDGGGLENLTPSTPRSTEGAPTWSPTGTQIAFTSDRAGENQLYVMSAQGTDVRVLVSQYVDRPTWSRLNFLAFTVGRNAPHDVGIYDFASPGVRVLTDGRGSNEAPAVAPNGRHIAFVTTRWGRKEIATIDRAGQNVRRVTEIGNNDYPNWQTVE
jgi:TolB protein